MIIVKTINELSIENLLHDLFNADPEALKMIDKTTTIDIPRIGSLRGPEALERALDSWYEDYPYELISIKARNEISTDSGVVNEFILQLREAKREFTLPIAVVVSPEIDGQFIRIYHSERLIHGEKKGRRAVWAADEGQEPTPLAEYHPAIRDYMAALASGDAAAVISRLEHGAVMDNGVRPVKEAAELLSIFTAMARTGGARLVRRNEFDNGSTVALEYTSLPRPGAETNAPRTPPGGGIGIYDYDEQQQIRAIRMYDDFDPEMLIAAGNAITTQNNAGSSA